MHISDKYSDKNLDKILNYKILDTISDKNVKIQNFGKNFGQNPEIQSFIFYCFIHTVKKDKKKILLKLSPEKNSDG